MRLQRYSHISRKHLHNRVKQPIAPQKLPKRVVVKMAIKTALWRYYLKD